MSWRQPLACLTCTTVLLAGCAAPPDHAASRTPTTRFASLSPDEALTPQALGARVRWSGGIRSVEQRPVALQCLTLLHANFEPDGFLRWPAGGQTFVACGRGNYDSLLIEPFTVLSIEGRVVGRELIQRTPVPLIMIDALYRHSDCVQGSEDSPVCFSGLLRPRAP